MDGGDDPKSASAALEPETWWYAEFLGVVVRAVPAGDAPS